MLILVMCNMNLYPVYPHRFENINTTEKFYSFFGFTLISKTRSFFFFSWFGLLCFDFVVLYTHHWFLFQRDIMVKSKPLVIGNV